ncbi:uncharacterized protein LOC125561789 isoform X2 [Nematostella vectensis]|uniref:uncharacterized protein LOC125561789 isoform X2 n=1 Tax=Nematostella vectensis TaxID=45351 RepID=UPI0020778ED8|nr:uncharacterized protein LOC125561789 isoform X2 [Nematostella vectensis]
MARMAQRDFFTREIFIPEHAMGMVIGKKGRMLEEIKHKTRVRPIIDKSRHGCIILQGSRTDVQKAKRMIEDIVESIQQPEVIPLGAKTSRVIGEGGRSINSIRSQSGARIQIKEDKAYIRGTQEQKSKAKDLINKLLTSVSSGTCVFIPEHLARHVIGKHGQRIKDLKQKTKTDMYYNKENILCINGVTTAQEHHARRKVKSIMLQSHGTYMNEKYCVVDGSKESEFELESVATPFPGWSGAFYKVVLPDDDMSSSNEMNELPEHLNNLVLSRLELLHPSKDEFEIDMWSHFGHAYIKGIDEGDDHEHYNLKQLQSNILQGSQHSADKGTWKVDFAEGLTDEQVEQLIGNFKDETTCKPANIRYDFSFFTPSNRENGCRRIRMMVIQIMDNKDHLLGAFIKEEGDFFKESPVQMEGVLRHERLNDNVNIYLCKPPTDELKLTIMMPSRLFDFRLTLRKNSKILRSQRTSSELEEENVLLEYLREALVLSEGQLQLSPDVPLPERFDLDYFRRCKRFEYSYNIGKDTFTLMFSKEEAVKLEESNSSDIPSRKKTDIHLHCDDWYRRLFEGDWEPKQIIEKFTSYMTFVRQVQKNIDPEEE